MPGRAPGHGGLCRATDVTALREYLATLRRLISEARERRFTQAATVRSTLVRQYGKLGFLRVPNIPQLQEELNGAKRVPR